MPPGSPSHPEGDFKEALGSAAAELWAELPASIEEFEHAVVAADHSESDESLRQELARYLHGHNVQTARSQ
jgi:uncharacterized membrane protein